jgi:hypothetical protein
VRYLDMLWASLPIICTSGDVFSEMVAARELGVAVPERDVDAIQAAILRLADDRAFRERCRQNVREARREYTWERTLAPLIDYCAEPGDAPSPARRARLIAMRAADLAISDVAYRARFEWPAAVRRRIGGAAR